MPLPYLDGLVAVLLVICIAYCMKLYKKVALLHHNKSDFAKGIKYFDDSILRAEASIAELRNASNKVATDLHETLEKANLILSDLSFMVDRAASLTNKLEVNISDARKIINSPTVQMLSHVQNQQILTPTPMSSYSGNDTEEPRTMALKSLLERISAAKDTQKKKVATQFEPPAGAKQHSAPSSGVSFLRTLRSISREDPI